MLRSTKVERGTRPMTRLVLRDAWLIVIAVLTLVTSTALLLRQPAVLPISPSVRMNEENSTDLTHVHMVGGYSSLQEMKDRAQRFPSVEERVALYMSNWYAPPCRGQGQFLGPHVHYNFIGDAESVAPLLAVREIEIESHEFGFDTNTTDGKDHGNNLPVDTRKYSHSGSNRTFVLDSTILDKGARVFFLRANEVRRCNDHSCEDTLKFVFPSLYRVDMASTAHTPGYPGNALDLVDGNSNHVVPVILQFGDMEVSRAFVPSTNDNETYPVIPVFKKFRLALPNDELCRVTAHSCVKHSMVPLTVSGFRRVQPIIAKFTYKRHYGMLEEIPQVDIPWHEKKDQAIFRGALTGMKRHGFRVVQNSATHSKEDMCLQIQRCKLVLDYNGSELVNASLVDVLTSHPNNILLDPVVPSVLRGIELYGPRLTFEEMLQYKALIMLEGNDVSTGLKWALYSNSVVLTPPATYTSWAMEELLIPWVHYIPLKEDLSDVEEKVLWVFNNQEKAQNIARAGTLWISDLAFHPDSQTDENEILDEMLLRYKQHFAHSEVLSISNLMIQK